MANNIAKKINNSIYFPNNSSIILSKKNQKTNYK